MGHVDYRELLDLSLGAVMYVEFRTEGLEVVDYSVVLLLFEADERAVVVRVYDAAHRFNEMHRFTRGGGKQPGVTFHAGTLGEGMRAAIEAIKRDFQGMIEGWESR